MFFTLDGSVSLLCQKTDSRVGGCDGYPVDPLQTQNPPPPTPRPPLFAFGLWPHVKMPADPIVGLHARQEGEEGCQCRWCC